LVVPRSIPTALATCVSHLHRDSGRVERSGEDWSRREGCGPRSRGTAARQGRSRRGCTGRADLVRVRVGVWGIAPGGRPRPATARTYNSCLLSDQKQRTYPLLLPPKPQSILLLLAGSSPRPRANWRQAMIEGRHTSRQAPLWPREADPCDARDWLPDPCPAPGGQAHLVREPSPP
jgi:hypothetical protein